MLQEIFQAIGLKEEETRVYLALIEVGPSTAGALIKKLGVPRASLYGYLERLQDAGCVRQSSRNNVKLFIAEAGEKLDFIYKRRIEELEIKRKSLQTFLPELQKRAGLSLMSPKMTTFEGTQGLQSALEDVLLYPDTQTYVMWPIKASLEAVTADFLYWHNKERIKRNISIEVVWPRKQLIDFKRYPFLGGTAEFLREIRQAPDAVDFTMGYWIYGDKIVFTSSRAESFGFTIESRELVNLQRTLHKAVWDMSTPYTHAHEDVAAFLKEIES